MSTNEDKYWIETDSFVNSSIPNKSDTTQGIKGTHFPYVYAPHAQNPQNPTLSRFEVFPHAQTFCSEPDLLYATVSSDLFVTYTKGFNMHTGLPNPHSVLNEYILRKISSRSSKKQCLSSTKRFQQLC